MLAKQIKSVRLFVRDKKSIAAILLSATVTLPYWWHLGSLLPGLDKDEAAAIGASSSLDAIVNNLVYAPHKLLQLLLTHFFPDSITAAKIPSAIFAVLFLASLYYIIYRWFGRATAVLAIIVIASTPWLILSGRSAAPFMMLGAPLVMGASVLALQKAQKYKSILLLLFALGAILTLYVPGGIWFVAMFATVKAAAIKQALKDINNYAAIAIALAFLVLITPLLLKASSNWGLTKTLIALPGHMPNVLGVAKNLAWAVLSLVWRTPYHSVWTIGRLPLLSLIQVILMIFGVYAMYTLAKPKSIFVLGASLIGMLIYGVNGSPIFLTAILIPLFIFIAAGLRYLYFQWHGVFPYNPLPRFLAVAAICALAGLQALYGIRYSLIAWPHTDATKDSHMLQLRGNSGKDK